MLTNQDKTRLAPTPSGFLHLGNVASFVLTYLLAKNEGWQLLLRIDDLDQARYRPAYAEDIFKVLSTLGLEVDEGPSSVAELELEWSQRHRLNLYQDALAQLVEAQAIFACHCSRKEVRAAQRLAKAGYPGTCREARHPLAPGVSWRLKTTHTALKLPSDFAKAPKTPFPTALQDFVIKRRDDLPAYQLVSVVDDLHLGVNRLVRGQDLWESSLAQWWLLTYLKAERPPWQFYHHPLLEGAKEEKLSKSQKAPSFWRFWDRPSGRKVFWKAIAQFLNWPRVPQSLADLEHQAREDPPAREKLRELCQVTRP